MNEKRFKQLFNSMTSTFNWLYLDSKDLAYIQSGLYPVRHADTNPDLPVWGDGRFDWAADADLPADFFTTHGGDAENGGTPYPARRSEEHTSELQSLMRISYAVFCLKKKTPTI